MSDNEMLKLAERVASTPAYTAEDLGTTIPIRRCDEPPGSGKLDVPLILIAEERRDMIVYALRAAAASAEPVAWQPIETAPKSRNDLIDVWCVDPDGDSDLKTRLTDVFWYVADEIVPHTGWARITDDGNVDFIEQEACGPCGLPAWKPVYWMQRPESPK